MISNDDFVFEDINYENLLYEVTIRKIKIELILLMIKFFRWIKEGETRERKYSKYSYYKMFIFYSIRNIIFFLKQILKN